MEEQAVNPGWRKSSYSNGGMSNCVEVGVVPQAKSTYGNGGSATCVEVGAAPWRKSSHSNGGSNNCVEAGHVTGAVLVRDTKDNGAGPVLRLTAADWRAFTSRLRAPARSCG
jgi:hypothetical protein